MPSYNDGARLDPSQVTDARGRGMGMPIAFGGGGIGILFLIVSLLLGGNPIDQLTGGSSSSSSRGTGDLANCKTGADAQNSQDCRVVLFVNSIQAFWGDEFSARGQRYQNAQTELFSQATNTACGQATTDDGPFYCPNDTTVYLDLSFFQELQSKFGAKGGDFAQAYVIAHEYGHHVQDMAGTLKANESNKTGANSASVRLELQADCYAGVWAHNAASTGYITALSDEDISQALSAASSVGDDRIQKAATGKVNPDSFTHGTADQRVKWFTSGYKVGDRSACDTFSGSI